MIEIVSEERCTGCDLCVAVCPVNVFDAVPDGIPVIARQADCQTCYMCEAYCPVDALYVAPNAEAPMVVSEAEVTEQALIGSYRKALGWSKGGRQARGGDMSFRLLEH